jgi:ribosome-binding factor A
VTRRTERLADLIRAEIADLLRREVHDPGIGFVTITGIKMAPDLRSARVFFSCLADSEYEKSGIALDRASGFLRREVGRRCQLRYAPELIFLADRSAETGARIEQILRESLPPEEPEAS